MGLSGGIVFGLTWSHKKSHTMILVYSSDDFRKYQKMRKLRFFKKNHKKICQSHLIRITR